MRGSVRTRPAGGSASAGGDGKLKMMRGVSPKLS